MANFRSEWGRLLVNPQQVVGGLTAMLRFFGAASAAGILTAVAGWFGQVPWWTLPLIAFVSFYLSWTAGMAWERVSTPQVEVGPLTLDANRWMNTIGLFYIPLKNGAVPATIKVKITRVELSGIRHMGRSWEGHWRDLDTNFDGRLDPREESQYGLIGIGTRSVSENPTLFVWTRELDSTGEYPAASLDAPLEQQGVTRVDIVVNCETADGQRGKPQERTFYIAPDQNSPVSYRIVTGGETATPSKQRGVNHDLRWYFDRFCTTVERVFGSRHSPQS